MLEKKIEMPKNAVSGQRKIRHEHQLPRCDNVALYRRTVLKKLPPNRDTEFQLILFWLLEFG